MWRRLISLNLNYSTKNYIYTVYIASYIGYKWKNVYFQQNLQ